MKFFYYILISFLFLPSQTFAARLSVDPATVKAGVGSVVAVRLLLDTPEEKINAVGVTLRYPQHILRFNDWNDGNSLINFWVSPPEDREGVVTLSGIVPGGYAQRGGLVVTLNFESVAAGTGAIELADTSEVLLNDGRGTRAPLTLDRARVVITPALGAETPAKVEDTAPPEEFSPTVFRDANIFDNRYVLIFATQDKGAGIDYYEVAEEKGILRHKPRNWTKAESPYLLTDQTLRSWIFVRAVDKNGNERIAAQRPQRVPWYVGIFIAALFVFIIVAVVLLKQRHGKARHI